MEVYSRMSKKRGSKPMRVRLKVREITEQQGHTRTWLSHHAEIQYDTVTRIWKEPETNVSIATLTKIAKALGVDVTELYEEVDD
jgi:DNA-binding Xre family transcriptional regulator